MTSCTYQTKEEDCVIDDPKNSMQYHYYKCCWFNGDSALELKLFFWMNRIRFNMLAGGWTWTINCSSNFVRQLNLCLSDNEFKSCVNIHNLLRFFDTPGVTCAVEILPVSFLTPCPKDIYWMIE